MKEAAIDMTRRIIGPLSKGLFMALDRVVPKNPNIWIVGSHQGLVGNPRFLVEGALHDERLGEVRIFVIEPRTTHEARRDHILREHGDRVAWLQNGSLKDRIVALRAAYVFISHDLDRDVWYPLRPVRGRRVVNLWHGIATKKGWLLKTDAKKWRTKAKNLSHIVSSSPLDSLGKAAVFRKRYKEIWMTGNPRNDLLSKNGPMGPDLIKQQKRLDEETGGKTLVLYAPTWRRYKLHHGEEFDPFKGNTDVVTAALEKHHAILGMRLHPADEPVLKHLYERHPALLPLGADRYPETQVLLKNAQVLVTDFSSIWVDHLLTRRPMIAYWPDLDDYSKHRGTIWELDKIFPGPITQDPQRLAQALDRTLGSDCRIDPRHQQAYTFARDLFHTHHDGGNTHRLLDKIHGSMSRNNGSTPGAVKGETIRISSHGQHASSPGPTRIDQGIPVTKRRGS